MTSRLRRRTGFEIELMAPARVSRRTLATDLAGRCGGSVRPVWHSDSEPSLVPGLGRFLHLTQGFEVRRPDGSLLCTLVDDITLMAGLDPKAPPQPGWFRVLTDDGRLLRLLARHSDPASTIGTVLTEPAQLWGSRVQQHGDVYRLNDAGDVTIALAAPMGGERERPCEIITPPLTTGHAERLEELLGPARELGFTVPYEAAVHLHVDGGPFRAPHALANLVRLFSYQRESLRAVLRTNPACRRLAPLPEPLVTAVKGTPTYAELRTAAAEGELTKYFDVNLTQLLTDTPIRDTVEIRILPGAIEAGPIIDQAALVELLLDRCTYPEPIPDGDDVETLLELAAEALAGRD
ncbi:amidoligase family protein [Actinoplanes palleronii]|uniref:amidoligase family protein n=1 Tax=Actinoplanes palleronii TaxID=113570 RepID=UPI0019438E7D|nr:amidoligase family protein [Actinoplanes palleronii]